MENKKLNEQELEQINGGQATLPLLSNEAPEADGANLVGVGKIKLCTGCGKELLCGSGHGEVTCSCGTKNKY